MVMNWPERCYNERLMLRRISFLVLAAGLAAAGPAPVSACALMAGLPADCQPMPDCSKMDMPDAVVAGMATSCCQVSAAPLPERQAKVAPPAMGAAAERVERAAVPAMRPADFFSSDFSGGFSPPDTQTLFCVFLV